MAGSCWVRGGLRAELRAARVLGLAPVRVVERAGGADRVAVSARGAAYGRAVTGALATLSVLAATWAIYLDLELERGPHTYSWRVAMLAETLAKSLAMVVAGTSGTRRMARLVAFVNELRTLNMVNKIDRLPKDSFGERWVWATLAAGVAVQGVSLAAIAYFTFYDVLSVLAYTSMYLLNVFRPVLVLHYVCLAALLDSSLEAARERLQEAALELGTGEEYDNAAYRKAYEAVEAANRTYLAACSLVRRLSFQEGPLVLLLLAAAVVRTLHCIYLLLSTVDVPESTSIPFVMPLFVGLIVAWIAFEVLLIAIMTEAWNRVARTMSSLSPSASALLQRAAPRGALAERLAGLQAGLQLGPAWFSPLDVCTLSRTSMIALLSFYSTAAAVMRQFNLRDYV